MICPKKRLKNLYKIALAPIALITCFVCSLLFRCNAYAITNATILNGMRTYCTTTDYTVPKNCTTDTYAGATSGNPPITIVGSLPSGQISLWLYGYNVNANVTGGSRNNKFNSISFQWHFTQSPTSAIPASKTWDSSILPTMYGSDSAGNQYRTTCYLEAQDTYGVRWGCNLSTDNYNPIVSVGLDWGVFNISSGVGYERLAYIGYQQGVQNLNSLQLNGAYYEYTTTSDPLVAGQQQTNEKLDEVNQNLGEINDFLQDTTPPSVDSSELSNSAGWLPPGPLDSVLNLPVQFIQGIVNIFTNTQSCQPLSMHLNLFNKDINIPCMSEYFGLANFDVIWNTVGAIISAMLIFSTLKWLYGYVNDTLSFRENNSGIWGGL